MNQRFCNPKYLFATGILGLVSLMLLVVAVPSFADTSNYLLGGGDVVKVTVYDHPDLATTERVNTDGSMHFPLVGLVQVGGLTVSQVAERISALLADGYIVRPQVSVFVEEFRSKKAVIMGRVIKPGLYELSGPTTLLELISKAGGLAPDAGSNATLKRVDLSAAGGESVISLDLKALLEGTEPGEVLSIMDGDNIYVPKAGMFYVTGEVAKPAAYKIEDEMTLIKAISMAGGFTDIAAKGKVKIIRKFDGEEKTLLYALMHEEIHPDDVIVVPESFF